MFGAADFCEASAVSKHTVEPITSKNTEDPSEAIKTVIKNTRKMVDDNDRISVDVHPLLAVLTVALPHAGTSAVQLNVFVKEQ